MASAYEKWVKKIADAAREEGIEQGIEKGVKKGKKESKVEIALKLLQRGGMAVEEIAELTGLTLKNVQKLVEKKAA